MAAAAAADEVAPPEAKTKYSARKEWQRFLEGSSVRGLKRTVASPHAVLRVFWALFLIGSVSLMSFQAFVVLQNYLSLKDVSMIRSRSSFEPLNDFPAATFCSANILNPVNSSALFTVREYNNMLRSLAANASNVRQLYALFSIDNMHGYLSQLDSRSLHRYVHPFKEVAALIEVNFHNGTRTMLHESFVRIKEMQEEVGGKKPSGSGGTQSAISMTSFYHPEYALCTTVALNMNEQDYQNVLSLQFLFILPAGRFDTVSGSQLDKELRGFTLEGLTTKSDMVMALHDRQVYPRSIIRTKGVTIRSGGLTTVRFHAQRSEYLSCLKDAWIDQGRSGMFRHSIKHCFDNEVEKRLNRDLNCTDDSYAFEMLPACLKLQEGARTGSVLKKLHTYYQTKQAQQQQKSDRCLLHSCTEMAYPVNTQHSDWAINDFQWKWQIERFLSPRTFLDDYLQHGQNDSFIADPMFDFRRYKIHLSTVLIYRDKVTTDILEEVELTTFANLWSSVGGAMSLYAGITLTLVAEFLDFLFCLAVSCFKSARRPDNSVRGFNEK